jgi:hypothetical protein
MYIKVPPIRKERKIAPMTFIHFENRERKSAGECRGNFSPKVV